MCGFFTLCRRSEQSHQHRPFCRRSNPEESWLSLQERHARVVFEQVDAEHVSREHVGVVSMIFRMLVPVSAALMAKPACRLWPLNSAESRPTARPWRLI
jgi:hypothetical protein